MPPRCWSKALEHLVDYLAARGIEKDGLLMRIGISREMLVAAETRVPLTAYYEAVEIGLVELGDPQLGLHYIESMGFATSGGLGFLAMFSATVGEAMAQFLRYLPILNEGEQLIQLVVEAEVAEFSCTAWGTDRPGKAQMVEMFATGFLALPALVSGAPVHVSSIRFTHQPATGTRLEEYQRVLGHVPRFGMTDNGWSFPADVLQRKILNANPTLAAFFEDYLKQLDTHVQPITLGDRVRVAIEQGLPVGQMQLSTVAARLNVTERTLQRQLSTSGVSFEDLLAEVRLSLAQELLRDGMAIAEISGAVGYADPAAFQRAFKRWTGITPGEWRAAHRKPS